MRGGSGSGGGGLRVEVEVELELELELDHELELELGPGPGFDRAAAGRGRFCAPRLAAVIDGRHVYSVPAADACRGAAGDARRSCAFSLAVPEGAGSVGHHAVAVYASSSCAAAGSALLIGGAALGIFVAPAAAAAAAAAGAVTAATSASGPGASSSAPPPLQPDAAAAATRPWIGSYYSGLQVPSASYAKNLSSFLSAHGVAPRALTVEDVLAGSSAGSAADLTFDQVAFWHSDNVTVWPPFSGFSVGWAQSMPATGFWYPYSKRAGERGLLPDEDPALLAASLAAHAAELATAGVDFVLGDGTNLSEWPCGPADYVCQPDLMQLRPFEVVTEAWAALRGAGRATPAVGVWGRANNGDGAIWREYLKRLAYNASSVGGAAGLAPVSPVARKPLFLLATGDPAQLNDTLVAEIMAAGALQAAPAWVCEGRGPSSCPADLWLFEAPCVVPDPDVPGGGGEPVFSSYLHPSAPCGHSMVTPPPGSLSAPLGNMTTVTFSTGWNSQSFIAPGKAEGLLVIKMFEDIWRAGGVQNIFVPSFNELFIGGQNYSNFMLENEFAGAMGGSSGPDGAVLPSTRALWVDGYADGRSRAFEPTEADGGAALELFASCVRVTALQALRSGWEWAGAPAAAAAGAAGSEAEPTPPCGVAGEVCCAYTAAMFTAPVWSLERRSADGSMLDALATSDAAAVAASLSPGGGYVQLGYPWAGAGSFVLPPSVGGAQFFGNNPREGAPNNYSSAVRGPFLVWDKSSPPGSIPDMLPLFLCSSAAGQHYLAPSADACSAGDGGGKPVGLQGFVAGRRSGAMPRALRRCANAASGVPYHAVDGPCAPGDHHDGLLGFVM